MKKNRLRLLPLDKLQKLAKQLAVELVMTPCDEFVTAAPEDPVQVVVERMECHHFDQLPVEHGKRIIGLVRKEHLGSISNAGLVRDYVEQPSRINSTNPLSDLFPLLADEPCLFIRDNKGIVGLVHRSDLNKQVVRTYFYLWLAATEMGLGRLFKSEYSSDDDWAKFLSKCKREEACKDMENLSKTRMDVSLVEYVCFSDLMNVVRKDDDRKLWGKLGYVSKKEWSSNTGKLVGLRNKVMHPTRTLLVSSESEINNLIDCNDNLNRLVGALHNHLT